MHFRFLKSDAFTRLQQSFLQHFSKEFSANLTLLCNCCIVTVITLKTLKTNRKVTTAHCWLFPFILSIVFHQLPMQKYKMTCMWISSNDGIFVKKIGMTVTRVVQHRVKKAPPNWPAPVPEPRLWREPHLRGPTRLCGRWPVTPTDAESHQRCPRSNLFPSPSWNLQHRATSIQNDRVKYGIHLSHRHFLQQTSQKHVSLLKNILNKWLYI